MPVIEDFSGDDTFTLNWSIKNFSLNTCTMGKSILSPDFEIKKLGDSCWQLELFPSGSNNDDYIACFVIPKMEDTTGECDSYRFTLSLRRNDDDLVEVRETWNTEDDDAWKCNEFVERDYLKDVRLPEDTFSIRCVIQPLRNQNVRSDLRDFEYLSQNLTELFEGGVYHDLILVSADNKRFKVHKCIMSVRWPDLPEAVRGDDTVNYSNVGSELNVPIHSDLLETMIWYVYSGTVDGPNVPRDVFKAAVRFYFHTLRKNLASFPKTYYGVTELTIDHKTVIWHLGDVSLWGSKPPSFIRILPITELYALELIIVFSFVIDSEGDEAIDIAFRFSSFRESMPISMNCNMFLSVQNGTPSVYRGAKYLFLTNDFWHFPLSFKKIDIPDKRRSMVTMEITMSDGPKITRIEKSETEFYSNFTPIRDLRKLSTDISALSYDSTLYHRDCSLKYPRGKREAHRSILWARWPQMRNAMNDRNEFGPEWCIDIDIEKNVLDAILFYMYSGNSEELSTTIAQKVLEVNENILMPEPLLAKCRKILENEC